MNEVLIDTNVFIYALDKDSIYHQQSSQILSSSNNILFTTSKNISELFAATSKININRVAFNRFYGELKQNIGILFPTSESLEVFEKLIKKYKPIGNRVFDIEIVSIMLSYNIKRLATINKKDFIDIEEIELIDM
jgi:predicted nucleic acid-binding protein